MEDFGALEIFAVAIGAAYLGYLIGRAGRGGEGVRESREERRMRQQIEAERLFSALSPQKQEEADRLLTAGRTIEAVKIIREESGTGLRDAKITADHRRRHLRGAQ